MNTLDGLAPDTISQITNRLTINEGCRLDRYLDSLGIPTIAIGFNLTRPDAVACLQRAGCANPAAVIAGTVGITQAQASLLMQQDLPGFIDSARASLPAGIFNALVPPRQAAIVDLVYNMGADGWGSFQNTRSLIAQGQAAKTAGQPSAHGFFVQAATNLLASAYAKQVGDRAARNAAMIRDGAWVDPNGNGSN